MSDCRTVCLTQWSAVLGPHRELFFPPFCSLCTPQTFSFALIPATCRSLRMTLQLCQCVRERKEEEYRGVVESFNEWCATNHLHINSTKTKELVMDFRRRKSAPTPISINGVTVDVVQDYKYLGVYLDNKLD